MGNLNTLYNDLKSVAEKLVDTKPVDTRQEAAELAMILLALNNANGNPDRINVSKNSDNSLPESFDDFAELVEDELDGAVKYHWFYKQTGEDSYKQLSKQELSHMAFWLEKAKSVANTPEQLEHIKSWKRKHDELLQLLPAR